LVVAQGQTSTLYAGLESGGVYRSSDRGGHWTMASSGLTGPGQGGTTVRSLAVDPRDSQVVYAGTLDGVFKSSNGGTVWERTGTTLAGKWVQALAVDPGNADVLYAGLSRGGMLFKSTNQGTNWIPASVGLPSDSILAIALDPSRPGTLYAGTFAGGIFKSVDSAANWTAVNTGLTNSSAQALAMDPRTPNTVYAGLFIAGVFKSRDGGASWTSANGGLPNIPIYEIVADPLSPGALYAGTLNGVYKSVDGGGSWALANTNLQHFEVNGIVIDPTTPSTLYLGVDYGYAYKSLDAAGSWIDISADLRSAGYVWTFAVDPITPSTVYAGTLNGVFKSTNGGANWVASSTGLGNTTSFGDREVSELVIDPSSPRTLYASVGAGKVFKSVDGAASWSPASSGLPSSGAGHLVIDPSRPQTLYAVGLVSGVYKSEDGGNAWTLASPSSPRDVTALVIDPGSPSTLYAGTNGEGVFQSVNGGISWSPINNGLTEQHIKRLAVGPPSSGIVHAATEAGIFSIQLTPTIACDPRPQIKVVTESGGAGRLVSTISAQASSDGSGNVVRAIQLTDATNASVMTACGERLTPRQRSTFAPSPSVQIIVERTSPGPFMARFVVFDNCGYGMPWPTFVGAGAQVP